MCITNSTIFFVAKRITLWVLACFLLVSCKPKVPDGVIQPDDMADMLYDMHMARAAAQQTDNHAVRKVEYSQAVL